jgi:hypothetical protein
MARAPDAAARRVHQAEAVAAGHAVDAERHAQGQNVDGEREAQREDGGATVAALAAPATLHLAAAGGREPAQGRTAPDADASPTDASPTLPDGLRPLANKSAGCTLLDAVAAADLTPDMLLHVCLPPLPPCLTPPLLSAPPSIPPLSLGQNRHRSRMGRRVLRGCAQPCS